MKTAEARVTTAQNIEQNFKVWYFLKNQPPPKREQYTQQRASSYEEAREKALKLWPVGLLHVVEFYSEQKCLRMNRPIK